MLDWDKLSSDDYVGGVAIEIADLAANVLEKDPNTGLYPEEEDGTRNFQQSSLPLTTTEKASWDSKQPPTITFR